MLLVEDDQMVGAAIEQAMRDNSYAVDWVRDGRSALSSIDVETYDLILLDINLPALNGFEILQRLRGGVKSPPVIMITARDSVSDKIHGLDLGADDYLVKPFEFSELLARIRAVSRRVGSGAAPVLSNGIINLNPATHEVDIDGYCMSLTAREFSLLHALLSRPGTIQSRSELERQIYGWNEEVESNAVEYLIHSLRKKLGVGAIRNVRGVGWMVDKGPK